MQVLKRDDGTTKNIYLIDKANIHNNTLQVLNQYEVGVRLAAMRSAGRQPSIVVLQEAFTADARRIAERAGYAYVLPGPGRADTNEATGATARPR